MVHVSTDYVVDSVHTLLYDGVPLRTIYAHADDPEASLFYQSGIFIERIGNTGYMFMYNGGDDSFPPSGIRCYSDSTMYYMFNAETPCDTLIHVVAGVDGATSIKPDVYSDGKYIYFSNVQKPYAVNLFSMYGQKIFARTVHSDTRWQLPVTGNAMVILEMQDHGSRFVFLIPVVTTE